MSHKKKPEKIIRYKIIRKEEFKVNSTAELLYLMEIYQNEWNHRDSMIIKHIYTYFFAILIIMILPYADIWGIKFSESLPNWLFPSIGIIMNFLFLFFGKAQAKRLKAIGDSYKKVNNMLPVHLQRIKLEKGNPKSLLNKRMTNFLIYAMFILLLIIGVVLLVISLTQKV